VEVTDVFGYYSFLMNYMSASWPEQWTIRPLMRQQGDAAAGPNKVAR
jgi:hypothetical protein